MDPHWGNSSRVAQEVPSASCLGSFLFSSELQSEFAGLSGDWNPIHMSLRSARRTPVGQPIVHGMHIVLSSLESIAKSPAGLRTLQNLTVKFGKPVYVGEAIAVRQVSCPGSRLRFEAEVDGATTTELGLGLRDGAVPREKFVFPTGDKADLACRELSWPEMATRSGSVGVPAVAEAIIKRFPNASKWLGVGPVAALLCLSWLVGMECPGLYSLFAGLTLEFSESEAPPVLSYFVSSAHDRFRLLNIQVSGLGVRGAVEALARHAPIRQSSIKELVSAVKPNEFEGQRALIVGGSRGLGELTAKVLAAGGGHPVISYSVGKEDAEGVAEEIRVYGGTCDVLKYDVRLPASRQLDSLRPCPPYAYYFATCHIGRRKTKRFDPALLDEFLEFYVRGFYRLCEALMDRCGQEISVFNPSSVFVEDRPREMTEYAMAKSAGEILCADLARCSPGIYINSTRLPPLLTDQTAVITPVTTPIEMANSIEAIVPIVRDVQAFRDRNGHFS